MAESKRSDLNRNEQDYLLAKVALNHYSILHEYFVEQMKYYTVACCNISLGGVFEMLLEKKEITYKIKTEFSKTPKGKKKKMSAVKYKSERIIAARNLEDWTKKLLSWPDAKIKVEIDGRDEQS